MVIPVFRPIFLQANVSVVPDDTAKGWKICVRSVVMVTFPGGTTLSIGVAGGVVGQDFALGIGAITRPGCVALKKGLVSREPKKNIIYDGIFYPLVFGSLISL